MVRLILICIMLLALAPLARAQTPPPEDEQSVAYMTVLVDPPEAQLLVDGELQPAGPMGRSLALSPGRHRVEVRFEGYETVWRELDLKPGRDNPALRITLVSTRSELLVVAHVAEAAIELDGRRVGYGRWEGAVTSGRHSVHVISPDGDTERLDVMAVAGHVVHVEQDSFRVLRTDSPVPGGAVSSYGYRGQRTASYKQGIYIYGYGAVIVPLTNAAEHERDDDLHGGPGGGGRIGFRLHDFVGIEVQVSYTWLAVSGSLSTSEQSGEQSGYTLGALRSGLLGRLMLPADPPVRFGATLGGGAVHHTMDWSPARHEGSGPPTPDVVYDTADGWNAFAQLELGVELEWEGVLMTFAAQAALSSTGGIAPDEIDASPYGSAALFTLGPTIGIGYGFW